MKYQKVIIIGLGIVIIGSLMYYFAFSRVESPSTVPAQAEQTTLQPQSLVDGSVTYEVTPKSLASSIATWDFEVSITTHMGSLDQDLGVTARLVDDKGNEYKPVKWEGSPLGGHHRKGILSFSPLTPRPVFVELKLATTTPRVTNNLRWNL